MLDLFKFAWEIFHCIEKNNPKKDTTGCGDNFAGGVIASVADQMRTGGNKPIDFLESVAWGVASGGFAGFYTGGTYFEEKNGKKREQVRYYFEDYLNQIQGE